MVAYMYERWLLTRGSRYSCIVISLGNFGILEDWSLRLRGCRLSEVVSTRGLIA